jgi:hypothetical protein
MAGVDNSLHLPPKIVTWVVPWGFLLATFALYRLSQWLSRLPGRGGDGWGRLAIAGLNFLVAVLAGLLFAASIYGFLLPPYDIAGLLGCAAASPEAISRSEAGMTCAQEVSYKLLATATGLAAAGAGAIRFYTERMALEAELHSYREALATFRRAHEELLRLGPDIAGQASDRLGQIALELGKIALRENESWIRAHRVRPLEAHV